MAPFSMMVYLEEFIASFASVGKSPPQCLVYDPA